MLFFTNMKKKLLSIFIFFLFFSNLYSETINGLFNINFGTEKSVVLEELNKLGWKRLPVGGDYLFSKAQATYANIDITAIATEFYKDKLYGFTIHIHYSKLTNSNKNKLDTFLQLLKDKYGFKNQIQNRNEKKWISFLSRNDEQDIFQIDINDETKYIALNFYSGQIDKEKDRDEKDKCLNDM